MAELTPLPGLKELRIEGQKTLPTGAVSPFAGTDDQTTPDRTLADWVSLAKDWSASGALQSVLDRHGAILLRGLPISSPDAFSQLLHAFGVRYDLIMLTILANLTHLLSGVLIKMSEIQSYVAHRFPVSSPC